MQFIKKYKFDEKIFEYSLIKKKLLLGICLGMQLLFDESEEFGRTKGLGLISGKVKKLKFLHNYPVPHIGWNRIDLKKNKNNFLKNCNKKEMFYFVHSYYCIPKNSKQISAQTKYGNLSFCSAVNSDNIFGTQFHPEKSSKPGISILDNLKNFI